MAKESECGQEMDTKTRPLSFTNISGGAARHEKVSPKTWRILAFADAIIMVPQPTGIYH